MLESGQMAGIGSPLREWAREKLARAIERAALLGELSQEKVLDAARSIEIPAARLELLDDASIEARDQLADKITKGHASLAAVSCGAAGAIPVGGIVLELIALAELNVVQVDHVARTYGFDLTNVPEETRKKLPFKGGRALLLVPILAALQVKALEREGKMESIGSMVAGSATRAEMQAVSARLAGAAALGLLKMTLMKPLRRIVPFAGSAISAWSSYRFTEAVGVEAQRYFRDLAMGNVVVRGRRVAE